MAGPTITPIDRRLLLLTAAVALTVSCGRSRQAELLMTWSEEPGFAGMNLPPGGKILVFRFVDDPAQGLTEEWSPALRDRLTRPGNPVSVTFDCWRQFGGTFGFNIVAIGGEPYGPGVLTGPSRGVSFSEGPSRPHPLESVLPE